MILYFSCSAIIFGFVRHWFGSCIWLLMVMDWFGEIVPTLCVVCPLRCQCLTIALPSVVESDNAGSPPV
jgi:hypothetical protein